jgi:hypothetical protein
MAQPSAKLTERAQLLSGRVRISGESPSAAKSPRCCWLPFSLRLVLRRLETCSVHADSSLTVYLAMLDKNVRPLLFILLLLSLL